VLGGNHFHGLSDSGDPGFGAFGLGNPFQVFALMGSGAVHEEFMEAVLFEGVGEIFGEGGHILMGKDAGKIKNAKLKMGEEKFMRFSVV
jgi:hypothetical protein